MAGGPQDDVAQHFVSYLRENAAQVANTSADSYFSGLTDFRSQIRGVFHPTPWEAGTSPFSLEMQHEQEALMNPEDKQVMRKIVHDAFVQTLKDSPDDFAGLIVGYAREGKNFFDEFSR
jgi:hypothetical protein